MFASIELDLQATSKKREEKAKAIDLIFRLIVINCIKSTISNTCYSKDYTCED